MSTVEEWWVTNEITRLLEGIRGSMQGMCVDSLVSHVSKPLLHGHTTVMGGGEYDGRELTEAITAV